MFERPSSIFCAPALALAVALCAAPGTARAQETRSANEENHALATALFKEARRLMEEGRVPEACRKFEESERLDPGGGTLLNLAACHEREGRTASAWTEFSAALAQARTDGRADRVAVAEERIASLERRLARLTIAVPSRADQPDLEVSLDGVPVRRPAWGLAVPADAGDHTIEAHAPGFLPWHASVSVKADGEALTIEIPKLEPAPLPPPVALQSPTPTPASTLPSTSTPTSPVRDIATVGSAAVGLAGLVLGSYFGLHAIALDHDAKDACPSGRCTNDAASTSSRATTSADLSTGAFAIGAAGVGAAAFLFFTRGHADAPPVTASVTPSGAAITWSARF